jgi:hypothetical protein
MSRRIWLACIAALLAMNATSDTPPAPMKHAPCNQPEFRQFDFWVGEWIVADASGKVVGQNSVTSRELGCVVVEQWTSSQGGTGMSMNYFDPMSGQWTQKWVGLNVILDMKGGMKDGSMVMEGPLQQLGQNHVTLLRGIWTPLPDGRVRQHFIESSDDGKTWSEWFDGYYARKTK